MGALAPWVLCDFEGYIIGIKLIVSLDLKIHMKQEISSIDLVNQTQVLIEKPKARVSPQRSVNMKYDNDDDKLSVVGLVLKTHFLILLLIVRLLIH